MTNRIDKTFEALREKREGALVTFITAGDPQSIPTETLIAVLAKAGADIVEVGIPYSDPLADGPSIQNAGQRALDSGTTPKTVLESIKASRAFTDVPIVMMTSYNLVLCYGVERFADAAAEAGADGAILTDLPPEEATRWKLAADSRGIATIFLVAPTSTKERIKIITEATTGFVYCVSRTGVTGAQLELPADLKQLLSDTRSATDKPLCVGFGVSSPEHVRQVVETADGAVIGSALVNFLHSHAQDANVIDLVTEQVANWKQGTRTSL